MSNQPNHFQKPHWKIEKLQKLGRRNPEAAFTNIALVNEACHLMFYTDYFCSLPTTQYLEIDQDAYNYIDNLKIDRLDGSFINLPTSLKISTPHWGADICWVGPKERHKARSSIGFNAIPHDYDTKSLQIRASGDMDGETVQEIDEENIQAYLDGAFEFKATSVLPDMATAAEVEISKEKLEQLSSTHQSRIRFVLKLAILLQTDGFTDHIIKYRSKVKSLKGRTISTFAPGTFEVHGTEFWVAPFVRQLRAARYYQGVHAKQPQGSRFTMVKGHIRTRVRIAA
jgi:hypothetical protein